MLWELLQVGMLQSLTLIIRLHCLLGLYCTFCENESNPWCSVWLNMPRSCYESGMQWLLGQRLSMQPEQLWMVQWKGIVAELKSSLFVIHFCQKRDCFKVHKGKVCDWLLNKTEQLKRQKFPSCIGGDHNKANRRVNIGLTLSDGYKHYSKWMLMLLSFNINVKIIKSYTKIISVPLPCTDKEVIYLGISLKHLSAKILT